MILKSKLFPQEKKSQNTNNQISKAKKLEKKGKDAEDSVK